MDKLTRGRRPIRAQLTRVSKDVKELLAKDEHDVKALRVAQELLEKTMVELENYDERIKNQLVEDNATEETEDEEFKGIEKYKKMYLTSKSDIEDVLNFSYENNVDTLSTAGEAKRRKFNLPEVKLRSFGGNLKDWLGWWSQFEKIHQDEELHDTDKFQYLSQAMLPGSEAKELIDSYPHTEGNYGKAIQSLRERFGRQDLLLQVYVRELLTLVISNVTSKDKLPLSQLYVRLESHLRSLTELNLDKADPATWLYPMVESSLSEETLRAWQCSPQSRSDGSKMDPPKSRLDLLMDFIKVEVQCEQQISLAQEGFQQGASQNRKIKEKNFKGKSNDVATAAGLLSLHGNVCNFCGKQHETEKCYKAKSMSMADKKKIIGQKRLCYQCLRTGHNKKQCRANVRCEICGKGHHAVICFQSEGNQKDRRMPERDHSIQHAKKLPEGRQETAPHVFQQNSNQCCVNILLNIMKVQLKDCLGNLVTVRLVGDSGSQRSYITTKTVNVGNYKWVGDEWLQNVLFGGALTPPRKLPRHEVTIFGLDGAEMTFELLVKDVISGDIGEIPDGPWISELRENGIQVSDLGGDRSKADILLGNDYWGAIRTGEMVKLPCGLTAENSVFGWSLGGIVPRATSSGIAITMSVCSQEVENLWKLETIGIRDPVEVKTVQELEREALEHFERTVTRHSDGRYVVSLPWKYESINIPSNYNVAMQRLKSTTVKLKAAGRFRDYHAVFVGWEKEGLIVRVRSESDGHFIPHRPVFKDSTTTPVRPVFDASCKKGRNLSLNDCLHKGPNLIELIPVMLLRFGERKIGVCADIRKAFQMICVRGTDQCYQRFLWWQDESCSNVVIYQHVRLVFGESCCPFLLGATINYHLNCVDDNVIATKLKRSFYVDNLVTSLDSLCEYGDFRKRSNSIMNLAKMELRQWACSFGNSGIGPPCGLVGGLESNEGSDYVSKIMPILGILWNREVDTLSCVVKRFVFEDNVTKRDMLSVVAQVFDPLGMLCPALLIPKLLVQEAWSVKSGWDSDLPPVMKSRFLKWLNDLHVLENIQIPRYSQVFNAISREVHVFVDSSQDAMAAVAFMRTEGNGEVAVQFLLAKSRLTPVKKPTIPRSELVSCVVGVRIASTVRNALEIDREQFTFWSDSSTALAWIKRAGDWGVFVRNRVGEILQTTTPEQWRHVPGEKNPADLPSRGASPLKLVLSKWWEGPSWLRGPKDGFPQSCPAVDEQVVSVESKKVAVMMTIPVEATPRFSSYRKNVAVMGWVLRFLDVCVYKKRNIKGKFLTIGELRNAEKFVLKKIQRESFPKDCKEIGGMVVIQDNDGVLRIKTRLGNRSDHTDFIYPIALPKSHPLVDMLVRDVHLYHGHGGIQFLASKIREKYWILQSRRVIRKLLRGCIQCRRHSGKRLEVDPAALPPKRVEDCEAFTTTGVDLAGPLFLRNGEKAWIVLYTCAVFRAVYLDVVTSLSTEAFLGSLERFVSQHGRPNTIYSDNGTNFVGAVNIFKQIDWSEVEKESHAKQIHWVFNPPTGAWWGGFWERLVRSVKELLRRMLGRSKLTYDELRTCVAGIGATINDRPLTLVREDNQDLTPLTPAMFIRPRGSGHVPELDFASSLKKSYSAMKERQAHLQHRFRKEYLALLVTRVGKAQQSDIRVGDVVLVGADNKKRF